MRSRLDPMGLLRQWWPVPAVLVGSVVIQNVFFESRYDVSGHAAEHLTSASAPFAGAALVFILLLVTPKARRQALVLVTAAAWLAAAVLVLVGNARVVDALVRAGLGHTPTGDLVENARVESAHYLANLAPWLGVISALALIAALRRYRHVGTRVAIGAAMVSVVFPPWIFPGAGLVVVVVTRVVASHRTTTTPISTSDRR